MQPFLTLKLLVYHVKRSMGQIFGHGLRVFFLNAKLKMSLWGKTQACIYKQTKENGFTFYYYYKLFVTTE